ncbi:MAG: nitroreductase family protein [Verrucomicrobiia bacterium]
MNVLEAINARQSIRAYKPIEIEQEKLKIILSAANRAPSAGNLQAYHIYIVKKQQIKDRLVEAAAGQKFLAQAPIVLVFCTDSQRSKEKFGDKGEKVYAMQDTCAAVCNAMLAAVELGLGSCWVDAVNESLAAKIINAKHGHIPAVILPIGYPAENPPKTTRRELSDIVSEV